MIHFILLVFSFSVIDTDLIHSNANDRQVIFRQVQKVIDLPLEQGLKQLRENRFIRNVVKPIRSLRLPPTRPHQPIQKQFKALEKALTKKTLLHTKKPSFSFKTPSTAMHHHLARSYRHSFRKAMPSFLNRIGTRFRIR